MYAETNIANNISKDMENNQYMYAGIDDDEENDNISDKAESVVYATLESDRGNSVRSNATGNMKLSPTDFKAEPKFQFAVLPGASGNPYNEVGDIISSE